MKNRLIADEKAKWVRAVVFDRLEKRQQEEMEMAYPMTEKALFQTAAAVAAGEYGEKIREMCQQPDLHVSFILLLLLDRIPSSEIFQGQTLKLERSVEEYLLGDAKLPVFPQYDPRLCKWLSQRFYDYLESNLYPSPLTVQQLLSFDLVEEAFVLAKTLKRAKAGEYFLSKNIEKAVALWSSLPQSPERNRFAEKIVAAYFTHHQEQQAVSFAVKLENDTLLREAAMLLTSEGNLEQALTLVKRIKSSDVVSHAKSNIVHELVSHNQFQKAKEIALHIQDRGYREDAFLDIVKGYLKRRRVNEAITFAESIENPYEKKKSAKIIEADLKAHHLDEKVSKVRQLFSLPLRRAA